MQSPIVCCRGGSPPPGKLFRSPAEDHQYTLRKHHPKLLSLPSPPFPPLSHNTAAPFSEHMGVSWGQLAVGRCRAPPRPPPRLPAPPPGGRDSFPPPPIPGRPWPRCSSSSWGQVEVPGGRVTPARTRPCYTGASSSTAGQASRGARVPGGPDRPGQARPRSTGRQGPDRRRSVRGHRRLDSTHRRRLGARPRPDRPTRLHVARNRRRRHRRPPRGRSRPTAAARGPSAAEPLLFHQAGQGLQERGPFEGL